MVAVTAKKSKYQIELKDNHSDKEICEVVLMSSPIPGCSEIENKCNCMPVVLVEDGGPFDMIRYANPLAFLQSESLPPCDELLKQYALGTLHSR